MKLAKMWKMYAAVACLCVALAMIFAVHATFARYRETAAQQSGVEFSRREPSPAARATEAPPAPEEPPARAKEPAPEKAVENLSETAPPAAPRQAAGEAKPAERAASPEAEALKQPEPAEAKSAPREKIEGEWYYSEVHKDWRFKRK